MKVYDLRFLLDKKSQEAGAYCLSHASKTGIMHASSLQLEMANRYVYDAFQPILEETGITKKDFFNNEKTKKGYRTAYINALYIARKYPSNLLSDYPNLFGEDGNINIKEFTTAVNDINKKWIEFKTNLKENPSAEQHLDTLRDQVSYEGFFATTPKNRKFLMSASRDQNRTEDRSVFKCLEPYITEKESVDYQQFMDSPELRGLYRKKYSTIKAELEQEQNQARNSYETADEAMKRISQSWASIATTSMGISKETYEEFIIKYPIEAFSKLTPLEISNLDLQTLKIRQNHINHRYQQMMGKRNDEIQQLKRMNEDFHKDLANSFTQSMIERVAKTTQSYNEISKAMGEKEGEKTSSETTSRKR